MDAEDSEGNSWKEAVFTGAGYKRGDVEPLQQSRSDYAVAVGLASAPVATVHPLCQRLIDKKKKLSNIVLI